VVPAKPGGGMHLTCKLVQQAFEQAEHAAHAGQESSMRITYRPGGVGAVAWNEMTAPRSLKTDTMVAFSGGSLLNLAQGKFGRASVDDVRWVAAFGADYGMIAVRKDSPFKTLDDLVNALRNNPSKIVIGASGTYGSQDWTKLKALAKLGGADPNALRFVAFEGGGEAFLGLTTGYVHAVSGDASEAATHIARFHDQLRVLAVLSDTRLPGALSDVPTAKEQGYDLTWPIIRGVYMARSASDEEYAAWVKRFDDMLSSPSFEALRKTYGLYPFSLTGDKLTDYVSKTVREYAAHSRDFRAGSVPSSSAAASSR
jgi:putative tricarboxylic transport membrane protein